MFVTFVLDALSDLQNFWMSTKDHQRIDAKNANIFYYERLPTPSSGSALGRTGAP